MRIFWRICIICLILCAISLVSIWYIGMSVLSEPPRSDIWSIILLDKNWNLLTNKGFPGGYMRTWTGNLDTLLIKSILSIEDRRFFEHSGVDIYGKLAALKENISAGTIVRGGSTITEQYIKNSYFAWMPRTFWQKWKEACAAIVLETQEEKSSILKKYLDTIYFWNKFYGIAAIIEAYGWEKNLRDDDILDIVTLIKYPNITEKNRERAMTYRNILKNKLKLWTDESRLGDISAKYWFERFPFITEKILKAQKTFCDTWDTTEIRYWTESKLSKDICIQNALYLRLSLDWELMEYGRFTLQSVLQGLRDKNVTNGALYILDPKNQKILAYLGSSYANKDSHQIDMITRRRSVGSILKPFVYLAALKLGYDGNEFILDDTKAYPTGHGTKVFVPMNYSERPFWPIRLSEALGNSLNSSTVRLSEHIGISKIYDIFLQYWLDLDHDAGYYGYSLVLWWPELTLENIVHAYTRLIDTDDMNLFLLGEILRNPMNRAKTFWISSILGSSLPLAVKTGTSTDFRDNWAVSYHPDAVIGVWVGNADNSPMTDVSWVSGAWPIWYSMAEYMIQKWLIRKEVPKIPPWVEKISFCLDTRCIRKELRYAKKGVSQQSRPLDRIYYESDFVTNLTTEEMKKWKILRK